MKIAGFIITGVIITTIGAVATTAIINWVSAKKGA